jgi:hypothetical protein
MHLIASYTAMGVLAAIAFEVGDNLNAVFELVLAAPVSAPLMVYNNSIHFVGLLIVYGVYAATFATTLFLLNRRARRIVRGFSVDLSHPRQESK